MSWFDFLSLKDHPSFIVGSDEVGTGALAGPIVIVAVAYPFDWPGMPDLRDSKQYKTAMQRDQRGRMAEKVYETSLFFSSIYIFPDMIDSVGMHAALMFGHSFVINECLRKYPGALAIIDGTQKPKGANWLAIAKADRRVPAVSAASVMAKEERDWWMQTEAHQQFPHYGFDAHVGYGTPQHHMALNRYGPCPLHRKSYRPIKRLLESQDYLKRYSSGERPSGSKLLSESLRGAAAWSLRRRLAGAATTTTKVRTTGGK